MQMGQAVNPFARRLTGGVRALLIVTASVFVVQTVLAGPSREMFADIFGLHLAGLVGFRFWQPVTYLFLHADIMHILMNMLVLYFFGCEMEELLGTRRFLKLYFGTGILAGFGWLVINMAMGRGDVCVGASGAVLGVIGAFAAMFPDRTVTLLLFFVLPVTMTARTMALGIGAVSLVMLISGDHNVAHAAHLAGGIAGYIHGLRIARSPALLDPVLRPPGAGLFSSIRARILRGRMHVVDGPELPPSPAEVDRILEKIKARGLGSLSRVERRALDLASRTGK